MNSNLSARLAAVPREPFAGTVYWGGRSGSDPLAAAGAGGRWSPPDGPIVLYTSLTSEGALAEVAFHRLPANPQPPGAQPPQSSPQRVMLHHLEIRLERAVRLTRADLAALGVPLRYYRGTDYRATQAIGAAAASLGIEGLIVPSARSTSRNLAVFLDNLAPGTISGTIAGESVPALD